ncbi:MAG TPA: redoxin domain-containing protein [Solirubrobacteraceae bacterium]|nr:redoxin domain-containing protein [Solirubrobacteraceae bacterium]
MSSEILSAAAEFSLPSSSGGPVSLSDLRADGPALLLFVSEECPTCTLTLRRLAPLVPKLTAAGVQVAAVFEDPLEVAARVARRTGFAGTVLSEPAPYEVSGAYELASLPTMVLVDRSGEQIGRVVGWDADGLESLLSVSLPDDPPRRKPGCAAKNAYDAASLRALDGAGFDELEEMFELGWSDGLPVIPPTRERVETMLGGRDPDELLGEMAPAMARITLERVAACAVLAGCRPEYFPVVVAAVQASLEPTFNVGGQAVTTQPVGQVIVVNGPVRDAIGLNGSTGALGPGWRPNMTIGRALRLVISLTAGGFPGRLDRSALANPGKVGLCFAEDEEVSPWEPMHVERGYDSGRSVVTVFGADAPLSISDHRSTSPEELARVLGEAAGATWSPNWWPLGGTSLFVLCPEHARSFAEWGWSKQRVREAMFETVRRPAASLRWGETTPLVQAAPDDQLVGKWSSPEDIVIVVAGGEAGRFSAVFGPCLGMDAQPISKEVPWIT